MRQTRLITIITSLVLLSGCGSSNDSPASPGSDSPAGDAASESDAAATHDASDAQDVGAESFDAADELPGPDSAEAEAAPVAVCGDGSVQPPEACDDGPDNGTPGHCRADCSGVPHLVSVRGDVFVFMSEVKGERLDSVKVSILEHPGMFVFTGDDAHFEFNGLEEGTDVTLVAERTGYVTTQTATFRLGNNGIDPLSIQMPSSMLFTGMLFLVGDPEFDKYCAIVTTVTRLGGSLFMKHRQGEAGSQVTIQPALPAESGPIYFNESVLPDTSIKATTKDGGVLFRHVPPGDYIVTGVKDAVSFQPLRFKCSVGAFINAGPTTGLQANVHAPDLAGGVLYSDDVYSQATDALCDKTAECVNENVTTPPRYPDVTVQSCKKAMRNDLSWIDPTCDAKAHVREAWKAFYDCRASDCTKALGKEDVCTAEEEAFTASMAQYAPCYTSAHPD